MFSTIFNKLDYSPDIETTQYKLLNSYDNYFSPYDGNSYDDATVRTCIDAIAKNAAKLKPSHIRRQNGKVVNTDSALNGLLFTRPNEYMSTYDFLYKIVTQLFSYNNAFAYVKTDPMGNIVGIYPIDYDGIELREYQGQLYCRFAFGQTGQITVPYGDLIHLRRHYNRGDIFGESNERPLKSPLNILNTVKQALENAVKNCTKLRGYLKFVGTVRDEDKKAAVDDFNNKFTDTKSATGIAAIDSRAEYHQLTSDIQTADHGQMSFAREDIYRYFGLSEKIITSSYSEEEWTAFYESVIEPLAIQLSQEFTAKLFTEREKGYGNEVVFLTNRLEYASLKSKTAMIQVLQQTGILTINEAREVFGYNALPDGDKRLVSLNYVDSQKQNKYQVGDNITDSGGDGNDK
jgi:HK97 family phage portal protein